MQNLERLLYSNGIDPVWLWPVGVDWRDAPEQLPTANDIDLIVVNGEGSMHHSGSRPRVDALADVAELGKSLGVPSFLINATLFNNEPNVYDKLRKFDGIYVRDSISLEELSKYDIEGDYVPDLTFSTAIDQQQYSRQGVLGIDSVLTDISDAIQDFCQSQGFDFLRMRRPAIRKKFIDRLLEKAIFNQRGRYKKDTETDVSVDWLLEHLQSKEFVITGRYHAATMCILTRTPFFALESNTPKVSSMLSDVFASTNRLISIDKIKDSNSSFQSYSSFTLDEIEKIDMFIKDAENASGKMIEYIARYTRSASSD